MANGYTYFVTDDVPMPSTREYLISIAHMFDVSLRDRPIGTVPELREDPETLEREKEILAHEKAIRELNEATDAELDALAQEIFDKALDDFRDGEEERVEREKRIRIMQKRVKAWDCPEDLTFIKERALDELMAAWKHDVKEERERSIKYWMPKESPEQYKEEMLQYHRRCIERAKERRDEEAASVKKQNESIQKFLDSLPEEDDDD